MSVNEATLTSVNELILTIVFGVASSLIATFIYGAYVKKRDKGDFKAESIALQLLDFAITIVSEEDWAEYYDQWLADLLSLETSRQRIRFAYGLPQAAFVLRTKALVSIPFVVFTSSVNKVVSRPHVVVNAVLLLIIICLLIIALWLLFMQPSSEFTWCVDQDWHRITCDTTHRLDNRNHPW